MLSRPTTPFVHLSHFTVKQGRPRSFNLCSQPPPPPRNTSAPPHFPHTVVFGDAIPVVLRPSSHLGIFFTPPPNYDIKLSLSPLKRPPSWASSSSPPPTSNPPLRPRNRPSGKPSPKQDRRQPPGSPGSDAGGWGN